MNKLNYFIIAMTAGPIGRNFKYRNFGYFDNIEMAMKAVERNSGGMDECLYDFIVIEPVPPGVYGFLNDEIDKGEEIWYKWVHPEKEHGRWERCKRPGEFENMFSFYG